MDLKKIIFIVLAIIAVICVIFTIFTVATNNDNIIENSTNSSLNSTIHSDNEDYQIDAYHFGSQEGHQSSASGNAKGEVHETTITNDKGEQETIKWSESEGLL